MPQPVNNRSGPSPLHHPYGQPPDESNQADKRFFQNVLGHLLTSFGPNNSNQSALSRTSKVITEIRSKR